MSISMKPKLFLCGGLQSSGSTFISWCFLQRQDMNGYFDANNDILTEISPEIGQPYVWYKTTISCFRMSELIQYYEEAGWEVQPLLVIRDPRHVWNSLVKKKYGRDGTTAEDPPLRIRMRRFKEDWEYFRAHGLPMIRFESFLAAPEENLRLVCEKTHLKWDDAMISWPKKSHEIANVSHGNRTFKLNANQGLNIKYKAKKPHELQNILPGDLQWLEKEFAAFNNMNDYALHLDIPNENKLPVNSRSIPQFLVTRRSGWKARRKPFRWIMTTLKLKIRQLLKGEIQRRPKKIKPVF